MSTKLTFFKNLTKIKDTWYDDLRTSTLPPRLTLLVLEKNSQEKAVECQTHVACPYISPKILPCVRHRRNIEAKEI
jgi:hypothetical protein